MFFAVSKRTTETKKHFLFNSCKIPTNPGPKGKKKNAIHRITKKTETVPEIVAQKGKENREIKNLLINPEN